MRLFFLFVAICLRFTTANPLLSTPTIEQRQAPGVGIPGSDRSIMPGVFPRTYIDPRCTTEERSKIKTAWDEAKLLVDDYREVHKLWFGNEWNARDTPVHAGRSKAIADNFKRLARLFNGELPDSENFLWWCNDHPNEDRCSDEEGEEFTDAQLGARTWYRDDQDFGQDKEHVINIQHVVFCPMWFEAESLVKQIARYKDDEAEQKFIENFESNAGVYMLHEIYHWRVVGSPPIVDYAYGAENSINLAREKGTEFAYGNSDSYTLDALHLYMMQAFKPTAATPESVSNGDSS
jgi:hypothetical protein